MRARSRSTRANSPFPGGIIGETGTETNRPSVIVRQICLTVASLISQIKGLAKENLMPLSTPGRSRGRYQRLRAAAYLRPLQPEVALDVPSKNNFRSVGYP
jgi:hypothetical protein